VNRDHHPTVTRLLIYYSVIAVDIMGNPNTRNGIQRVKKECYEKESHNLIGFRYHDNKTEIQNKIDQISFFHLPSFQKDHDGGKPRRLRRRPSSRCERLNADNDQY
jgi:hypothetical protein